MKQRYGVRIKKNRDKKHLKKSSLCRFIVYKYVLTENVGFRSEAKRPQRVQLKQMILTSIYKLKVIVIVIIIMRSNLSNLIMRKFNFFIKKDEVNTKNNYMFKTHVTMNKNNKNESKKFHIENFLF